MFNDKMENIKELTKIEINIYEIIGAIFDRENSRIFRIELEKFDKKVEELFIVNNVPINTRKKDKKILLNKYQNIVRTVLTLFELFFSNIIENLQKAETEQNVAFIQRTTLEFVENIFSEPNTIEEKENIIMVAKSLNISEKNLTEKKQLCNKKIKIYEDIGEFCKNNFDLCNNLKKNEIKNFSDNLYSKIDKLDNVDKNNFLETIDQCLNDLDTFVISELRIDIEKNIQDFIKQIDNMKSKII